MTDQTIYRDDSPDGQGRPHLTQIFAQETPEGALWIYGFHAGEAVEERFGSDDYRFGLTLRKKDFPRALTVLLADRFNATEPLSYPYLVKMLEAEGFEINASAI